MRKIVLLVGVFLLVPLAAHAQNNEVFVGYTFQPMEVHPASYSIINGWEGSYTYKLSSYFGFTGDVTGLYGTLYNSRMNFHSYLFGPQVQISLPQHFSPFVHSLFGWSRESLQSVITRKFSAGVGGGVDYGASNNVSFRLIQADFITGNFTQSSPESRFSSGVVFRF